MAIVSSGQKDRVKRRETGSVKIWELDSDNSDLYSDSSVESDTDESSDSWRSIGILSMHICSAALSFVFCCCCCCSPSHSSVRILFRLPHFARSASRKTEPQKIYLSALSANTRVFWRFARKFHCEKKNFPNADWLSDLRTQLKAFVGGVCLRSKRFFLALCSPIIFFAWSRHFK